MLIHSDDTASKPSRVVVLGARGFIAAELCAQLSAVSWPYIAIGSAELDLTDHDAAIRLAAILSPTDSLVMLSALTPDKGKDRDTFFQNLAMGETVCTALEHTQVSHVIYLSSDAVYPIQNQPISEKTPAAPLDLYGVMHRTREMMLEAASNAPVSILRATLIYGAADTHNSYGPNRLRRMAAKDGKIILFGAGEELRDHVLVDDAARFILAVLERRSKGVINVASGNSIDYDSLARLVAANFDRPIDIVHTSRNNIITHRHFDTASRIRAFPNFRFTTLPEGLAKTHRSMLAQNRDL